MSRPALSDYDAPALARQLVLWGGRPSCAAHAVPLLRHFTRHCGQVDFSQLQIGPALRQRLLGELPLLHSTVRRRTVAEDQTVKLLVGFGEHPEDAVESVLMPDYRPDRAAACVSSQIGCALGCDFCATARGGRRRDLTPGEVFEQFLHLRREAHGMGRRISTVVFMGMGEPLLLPLGDLATAINRMADPQRGGIGWRQITISTVGIVPAIDRLAEADLGINLAVSLHAPDDQTRNRLLPINRRYPIADVLAAADRFQQRSGRIVSLQYCLLEGVNDADEHAVALARLLDGRRMHLNLIPYNPIGPALSGATYRRPARQRVCRFMDLLRENGVVTHTRRPRGDSVAAACGQLRGQL